jgi:hypothetical protein
MAGTRPAMTEKAASKSQTTCGLLYFTQYWAHAEPPAASLKRIMSLI